MTRTTVTLELDEEHSERLKALAAEWQADAGDVVAAALDMLDQAHAEPTFTPEQEAAIREGLAAIERGEVSSHPAVVAEMRAKFGK